MLTKVVNCRLEPYDVYIGRASAFGKPIFGNPFIIGKHGDRGEVLKKYREYLELRLYRDKEFRKKIMELKGKVLGCHCKPLPCHGDIIAEWLESHQQPSQPTFSRPNTYECD